MYYVLFFREENVIDEKIIFRFRVTLVYRVRRAMLHIRHVSLPSLSTIIS